MAKCDAGGSLLREIAESVNNVLDKWSRKGTGKDPGMMVKGKVLDVVLGGGWRGGLDCAMGVADWLLGAVKDGYVRVYDGVVDFRMELTGPGLVGTGSGPLHAVFEVGLEVDWLLGLPYYPGSTLKGASRAVAEELLGDEAAKALFGVSPERGKGGWMGVYGFAPAYPVGCRRGKPCLVLIGDVVTPHYYVPGRGVVESELDAQPTPIQHVSIAPGTVFRFIVGVRMPRGRKRERVEEALRKAGEAGVLKQHETRLQPLNLAKLALRLLGTALMTGFAARSARGYNAFTPLREGEDVERRVVSFRVARGR